VFTNDDDMTSNETACHMLRELGGDQDRAIAIPQRTSQRSRFPPCDAEGWAATRWDS
jgi:hypothetical protein